MKHSLRFKITIFLSLSLVILIFLCWFLNSTFIERYYQSDKVKSLRESYYEVNSASGDSPEVNYEDISNRIERIETANNVNVYIISIDRVDLFGRQYMTFLYPIEVKLGDGNEYPSLKYDIFSRITSSLKKYIFSGNSTGNSSFEILMTEHSRFDVFKAYDPEVESYFIDLVGVLDNGYLIFTRASYENIQESADISSRFMAIIGGIVIVLGTVFMFLISRTFTKPILELADISDKMASLDFEARYSGRRKDEIGVLGNSMNILSEKLETTVTELKEANLELERDIANKVQIDELRKEFLSNVSHELKTPIALIQGYAEGLQDNINDDAESRNFYCEVIIDEARKMNNMVKKLLSLNEIEFGSGKLDMSRFDIVELVRNVAESVDILAKSKNVKVVFEECEPVFVWADESMIEEVVTNYLSNALNHVSELNVIDISFSRNSDKIRVSVFNTGSIIPEEDINNIWDKFYKVDKARTREYGGSGIGLSIVKAIMDLHNEQYGVKNHTAGVEFWFELDTNSVK